MAGRKPPIHCRPFSLPAGRRHSFLIGVQSSPLVFPFLPICRPKSPDPSPPSNDDPSDEASMRHPSTFLNAVDFGNIGAGKSALLNSLIGYPVLPTGENQAMWAPIVVDLQRDPGLSKKSIVLQIDSKSQQVLASALQHSLQDRLSKEQPVDPGGVELMRFTSSCGQVQICGWIALFCPVVWLMLLIQ